MTFIRQHFLGVLVAIVVVGIISSAIVTGIVVRHGVNGSELRACHRLNIQRAATNRGNAQDYAFDTLEYQLVLASLKHQTGSTPRTPKQEAQFSEFIGKLGNVVASKEWIPLTNCHEAVFTDHAPPQPIRFSEKPAPPSALTLGAGQ